MLRIVTDSTASIPKDIIDNNDIEVVSMYLHYNGAEYEDSTMDVDEFYRDIYDMVDNIPTSSQPSQGVLENLFEQAFKRGDEVLGIFMSSKMSGTVEGALRAARSVAARNLGATYRIIDSTSNSLDEGWSVLSAVAGRAAGCTIDQCCDLAVKSIKSSRFLFTPESLRFLKAGGRIGSAAALLGNIMKLCPIITVRDGESATFAKVRTHKRALAAMAAAFKSEVDQFGLKNVIVHYIGSSDEARVWARDVIEPICKRSVRVAPVSPCIGLHVGPAVAISYECDNEIPDKVSSTYPQLVFAS